MAEASATETASRRDRTVTGRTARLAGATGLVGGHCLELLLEDDTWEQVASARALPRSRSTVV